MYLSDVVKSRPAGGGPRTAVEGEYWLGRGRYTANFVMFDGAGDVCRKEWQIDARLNFGGSKFGPILPPRTVADGFSTALIPASGAKRIRRLTILLHAASLLQNQTSLLDLDRAMLLDSIVALMEEARAQSVQ